MAGPPVNSAICAWVGPSATKLRPCRPRVFQATSEVGLPDRSRAVGWTVPASVVVSLTLNAALDTARKPRKITPVSTPTTSSTTAVTAIVRASHSGSLPIVRRSTQPVSRRRTRPSPTSPANTSSATTAMSTESYPAGASTPMSSCRSTCHRQPATSTTIANAAPRIPRRRHARRVVRGGGCHRVTRRTAQATLWPTP